MTKKFMNKYRNESLRLKYWDYGRNGDYFLTICTKDKDHFFGEIKDREMFMNKVGQIAQDIWFKIPQQFPFAKLENFVVMPNHVHGILVMDKIDDSDEIRDFYNNPDMLSEIAKTMTIGGPKIGGITGNYNPMFKKNVSRVMRWYKGRCTFEIRKLNPNFGWQPKFYDNIIRNDRAYRNISQYIIDNPKRWKEDKFYKE